MKIGFIGTGYVGLVSGLMCASIGHDIISVDKSQEKIDLLSKGVCTIYEKDLDTYLNKALDTKSILFTTDYRNLSECKSVFICVGTPSSPDGSADLSYVYQSASELVEHVSSDCLIVIKSTVPPGSAANLQKFLKEKGFTHKVASNPEFLREGSAVEDFLNPDRIVAGGDQNSIELIKSIYEPLLGSASKESSKNTEAKFLGTDTTTSEMIKYCSNSFLAIKLSFINEMSDLCEEVGGDVASLSEGIGLDKRIGRLFLNPGPGYGGSCFPKDTLALSYLAKSVSSSCKVLDAAISSNLDRYELMRDKISALAPISSSEKTKLTILGAAFKAGTDDVRESPAVRIIELLSRAGYEMNIYDPVAGGNFDSLDVKGAKSCVSILDACKDSSGIVILTEWPEFAHINYLEAAKVMKEKLLIDLRMVADIRAAKDANFRVHLLGRKGEI